MRRRGLGLVLPSDASWAVISSLSLAAIVTSQVLSDVGVGLVWSFLLVASWAVISSYRYGAFYDVTGP